jgi:2-phospho-L-lactate guanylyltransferase
VRLAILIPAKDPGRGKSRLQAVLGEPERMALNLSLARGTFELCRQVAAPSHCYVATASDAIAREAQARGLAVVREPAAGGLNAALAAAAEAAMRDGAGALLVVPTDLVFINAASLRRIIGALDAAQCVLVPDRHRSGTNAMGLAPARSDLFRFGADSLREHEEAARAAGATLAIVEDERLALDLDLPQDLELWRAAGAP